MTLAARFRRSLTLWIGLASALSYWIVAPFLPTNLQTEWLRVFMIVFSGTAIVAWFPAFREIVLRPSPVSAQQSIMGQVMFLTGVCGGAIWLLLWRMDGQPAWMVNSDLNGFWIYLVSLGCFYSLIAPKDMAKEPPRTRWGRVAWAFVISLVLGFGIVHMRPDITPVVDWLKQRVSEVATSPAHSSPLHKP
ncbi:hypothetical protein CIW48_27310 [Methylobacterium sp. P1-11]|uniref:hypothetical protein n=1 Tax=Methylobacterium sp. P1-11 TaxID=2024616 RepID=UPI0011EC3AE8|nr:hypothetical protein [Methylobacterium sp. P1-11]KAA0117911.1 hypothetical protein CIW48_27310 [Methylobacterium sp. P1-11]